MGLSRWQAHTYSKFVLEPFGMASGWAAAMLTTWSGLEISRPFWAGQLVGLSRWQARTYSRFVLEPFRMAWGLGGSRSSSG